MQKELSNVRRAVSEGEARRRLAAAYALLLARAQAAQPPAEYRSDERPATASDGQPTQPEAVCDEN